jgi:hypothetical protein
MTLRRKARGRSFHREDSAWSPELLIFFLATDLLTGILIASSQVIQVHTEFHEFLPKKITRAAFDVLGYGVLQGCI